MMKKSRILALALVLIMVFSACAKEAPKYEEPSAEKTLANSFLIDKDGKTVKDEEIGERKVIQIYFDPMCSSCIIAEEIITENLEEILEDNAVIRYNPVAFLNDGGEKNISYSQRIAALLLSVNELEEDENFEFLKSVMNLEFIENIMKEIETKAQQDEKKYVKDEQLTDEFFKLQDEITLAHVKEVYKGADFDKIKENSDKKVAVVKELTETFLENEDLKKMSKDGESLYTPFFIIEGMDKVLDSDLETLVEDLKGAVKPETK